MLADPLIILQTYIAPSGAVITRSRYQDIPYSTSMTAADRDEELDLKLTIDNQYVAQTTKWEPMGRDKRHHIV